MVKILQFLQMGRCAWATLATGVVVLFAGCAQPLLPPARIPRMERTKLPDEQLLTLLQQDWELLKNRKLTDEERAKVVARYNQNAYLMMRRYRHDLQKAMDENNRSYMPEGVVFRQDGIDPGVPLRDIYEDIVPAVDVKIDSLQEHYTEPGLGVPMVGVIPADNVGKTDKRFSIASRGTIQALTVLMEFPENGKHRVIVHLIPRNRVETYRVGSINYPLAADISAPIEVYWNLTRVKEDRMLGLLRPQELRNTQGLSCIEAYNPKKIPVILTHGLMSSAGTFDNLVNRLICDPLIRKHYQFWYYNYPTGVAWTVTARHYRESLQKVRAQVDPHRTNKNWEKMIVVGHSMGGLITHYSQCTEPWKMLRDRKIGKLNMNDYMNARYINERLPFAKRHTNLQKDYYFRPVEAARVIYLATPHRGAPMAQYSITGWLMGLIELPQNVVQEVFNIATLQQDMLIMKPSRLTDWFTSGDQLSPEGYSIKGLKGLAVRNVPTHSIIGDRGKNNTPKSSDGVVPYWSSHIPWGTEKIVPADHSVQDAPETAEEIKRILKEHLKSAKR
ncbi:MAG: hypothetical protein IJY53_08780 [Akkermansia sp.]|nr:hypothetical protein [Akkermansia sp.]